MANGTASFLAFGSKRSSLKNARADIAGMEEFVAFMSWMSSKQKNRAMRRVYMLATKNYRKALRANTPENKYPQRPSRKPNRTLKNSVGVAGSRKYGNNQTLIDPLWVGHLVKKGAFHNHLIVRGTKSWRVKKKPYFTFKKSDGNWFRGVQKKRVYPKGYVAKVAANHERDILNNFGNAFVGAMRKEALSSKYNRVFR